MVQTAGPGMLNQGPGLAGCLLPRIVLERARTVAEAIDVLREVPGSGFGLVYVLADAGGDTAIVEKVYDRTVVRSRREGFAWAVNRFVADELQDVIVDIPIAGLGESNSVRCAAFEALGPALPATRDELIRTCARRPSTRTGWAASSPSHRRLHAARGVLAGRLRGINEPFRQYGVTQSPGPRGADP